MTPAELALHRAQTAVIDALAQEIAFLGAGFQPRVAELIRDMRVWMKVVEREAGG